MMEDFTMTEQKKTNAAATTTDERSVEFIPFGGTDKLRLTASMVQKFIAVPTRSGAVPSERDCIRFIMLCRGKRANPFEGDCFLIGYDSQNGPSFSLVCGIEMFLKRAASDDSYDGRESGVIVRVGDTVQERPGSIVYEREKLLGGWAKVYRKDRHHPEYKAVKFETYNTGRSRWEKDPGGQIEKVALSQALRQAFPTPLGGLYTQEEMERVTETGEGLMSARAAVEMPTLLPESEAPEKPVTEPATAPATGETKPPATTAQREEPGKGVLHIVGPIERISEKAGKKGIQVKMGEGLWVGVFEADHIAVCKRSHADGQQIEMAYVKSGQYWNCAGVSIISDAAEPQDDKGKEELPFDK